MVPDQRSGTPHAPVRVLEETETRNGWRFLLAIDRPGPAREFDMTLSWVDHDHWTGGSTPPSVLASRLLSLLAERVPDLPARFDAARARRWVPDIDERLQAMP